MRKAAQHARIGDDNNHVGWQRGLSTSSASLDRAAKIIDAGTWFTGHNELRVKSLRALDLAQQNITVAQICFFASATLMLFFLVVVLLKSRIEEARDEDSFSSGVSQCHKMMHRNFPETELSLEKVKCFDTVSISGCQFNFWVWGWLDFFLENPSARQPT